MRHFDYTALAATLLKPEIVKLLVQVHEAKGRELLLANAHAADLETLVEVAKIQSTGASNRLENVRTSERRLAEIMRENSAPRNRPEEEIAGYRDVLNTIHESHAYIAPSPGVLLQLHRDLYSFSGSGGRFKIADNVIEKIGSDGVARVRFVPVPAFQTETVMAEMCDAFNAAWNEDSFDKLLLIPLFVLDFLCVHPFSDGNGRMNRLLSLLLLYRAGLNVGKYVSLELLIEKSKESYYEVLQESSANWHENSNDYEPFVRYFLGILLKAYADLDSRLELLTRGISKAERVREVFSQQLGKLSKKEILELCPGVSKVTVERALAELVKENFIVKVGSGPATAYVKRENSGV